MTTRALLPLCCLVACNPTPAPAPAPTPTPTPTPAPAPADVSVPDPLALWSQVVDSSGGHTVEARWVLPGTSAKCGDSSVQHGTSTKPGVERVANPRPEGFDITVCAAVLDDAWTDVSLMANGIEKGSVKGWGAVEAAVAAGKPVIALGDTGCRDDSDQSCDEASGQWGFPGVLEGAAKESPALFLHVGDYRYRGEDKGAPDSWSSWYEDFLRVVDAHGREAPWVLARGNHEQCAPGSPTYGAGYWWLLGPTTQTVCPTPDQLQPTWHVDVKHGTATHRFVVVDTSDPSSPLLQSRFEDALKLDLGGQYTRWIHHHPLLGLIDYKMPDPADPGTRTPFELALGTVHAADPKGPQALCTAGRCSPQADIVGHEHFYELVRYQADGSTDDVWPQTLIVGHGGVEMRSSGATEPSCNAPLTVTPAGDGPEQTWTTVIDSASVFGFVSIDLASDTSTPSGWTMTPKFTGPNPASFGPSTAKCTDDTQPMAWSTTVTDHGSLGFPTQ